MTRAKLYIGGEWVSATAGNFFESRNPSDGSLIATLQEATSPDLDLAVAAANGVNKFLRESTVEVRASWCEAVANKIEASAELHLRNWVLVVIYRTRSRTSLQLCDTHTIVLLNYQNLLVKCYNCLKHF